MDAEWLAEIERRAVVHGVLADPGRLAVVELLSWGDRSPSELGRELGMASNLLAHHVAVLVDHGLVRRHRSEGDRRRTYLSLVPQSLLGTEPAARTSARVLFVCTANSARSQLAAALWRQVSPLPAASAGTHPGPRVDPGALAAAQRHGLDGLGLPRALQEVLDPGDYVVTVCDGAHEETGGLAASHWSVPDPVGHGEEAFERVLDELGRRVADLAPRLVPS